MPNTPPTNTPNPSGETPYHGPERRTQQPAVVLEQHLSPGMPPGYKDMTLWQKAWSNFGILGIGMLAFISFMLFFQSMYKDEIQDRRTRDAEDREIRRAEVAQQDRRAEQMASELRLMRISFESVATRIETGTARMENAKARIEQLAKDLDMMVKRILEIVKKPTSILNPMLHLIEGISHPPETAPEPRKAIDN